MRLGVNLPGPREWGALAQHKSNDLDSVLALCVLDVEVECLLWTGSTRPDGYGRVCVNGTRFRVHRYVYEQLKGPIPAGLVLDHLCRVRCCCNPDHMEPVTTGENVRRAAPYGTIGQRGRVRP